MSLDDADEFSSFLNKIENIESIVKGLTSNDPNVVNESMQKADKYQAKFKNTENEIEVDGITTKTGYNRTLINKISSNDDIPSKPMPNDQQGFMAALEQDAKERYERRKANEKTANELKDKGNAEFAKSNYEKAIEYYSEGIKLIKDNQALYTNRAQAYIKLEKYNEAISDCDWALRVNEKCVKAFIHKGRAFTYLKKFDEAISEFEKAKEIDPKQENSINDYIKEVERCRNTDNQEKSTQMFIKNQKEPNDVVNILNKIYKTDQPVIYYAGGLRSLGLILTDETQRTLFRTQNGFKIPNEHPQISRCLFTDKIEALNKDEIDLLSSFFELYKNACKDCDENMKTFFKIKNIVFIQMNIIQTNFKKISNTIKTDFLNLLISVIDMLFEYSVSEYGRHLIIENFDANKLSISLLNAILTNDRVKLRNDVKIVASQIVQNLTVEKKFTIKLSSSKEDFQLFTDNLISSLTGFKANSIDLNRFLLIIISNLITQQNIRNSFIENEQLWSVLVNVLEIPSLIDQLSNIFINLCSKESNGLLTNGDKLIKSFYEILTKKPQDEKLIILIGNIIQNNAKTIKQLDLKNLVPKITQNIKNNENCKPSVKLLALLTQNEKEARRIIIEEDNSLKFLYNLFIDCSNLESLSNKTFRENGILINNSVLCMTHCVDENKSVSKALTNTNIIMDLLYMTRDMNKKDVQKNCAILLAKLAKYDEKHLLKLRELHGIEILHTALKGVEI